MKTTQKKEILWNITNSALAGVLVLLGALTTGEIDAKSFYIALLAAVIVAISQFKEYWTSEKAEYCTPKLFSFIK